MSRKIIPEKTVIFCDLCGNGVGKEENTIKLDGASGDGTGPAYKSGIYDVCNACYDKFVALILVMEDK